MQDVHDQPARTLRAAQGDTSEEQAVERGKAAAGKKRWPVRIRIPEAEEIAAAPHLAALAALEARFSIAEEVMRDATRVRALGQRGSSGGSAGDPV